MTIDVIIPVYKPEERFFNLIERMFRQTVPVRKVILMNTEKKYWDCLEAKERFPDAYRERIEVHHLSKEEFDHGGTRNAGVEKSDADYFICMTQDALPRGKNLVENLMRSLCEDDRSAAAYARQLPGAGSSVLEIFARKFNYPGKSCIKKEEDREKLGIKTYFCSNVCAVYKRDIFDRLGGFAEPSVFNEDMVYCAKALKAGYQVVYAADAKVIHSHNYNGKQQFKRNFDIGASQAMHPEVFGEIRSEKEGIGMVKAAVRYLIREHRGKELPGFFWQCACKYAGYLLGKHYERIPRRLILQCTSNREFWLKNGKQFGNNK